MIMKQNNETETVNVTEKIDVAVNDFVEKSRMKKVLKLLKLVLIKVHHSELQLIFQ